MVLAAGLSARMAGELPKPLLPYRGGTVGEVSVASAVGSRLDRVVVVVGHRAGEVGPALAVGRAEVVANPGYRRGNMTSLRAGAAALAECAAVVVLLADMPEVDTATIDRFVDCWEADEPWAAVAAYRNGRGHPLLFSSAALARLVGEDGPKASWRFLEAAGDAVTEIRFDRPRPRDINRREDYLALITAPPGG
jgi:molybdenum cofactor cytidylyltransferase